MAKNLGDLADALYTKNEELAKLNAKVKLADAERIQLQNEVMAALDDAGTTTAKGKRASVSLGETSRFNIADFDLLSTFLIRKKALHLFERRISSKAASEMIESLGGKPIPGLSIFTQRRINVSKV